MTTHEKALEAARKAVKATAIYNPTGDVSTLADPAIRTYLSALLPEDAAGLVEPLSMSMFLSPSDMIARLLTDRASAATLIQSQAARIAELEAGLAPFSDMAGEMFARGWDVSRVAIALDNPNDPHRVTASDFFTARALLNRRAEG